MEKKNRIFISYSYSDKESAIRITEALREKGVEIFYDSNSMSIGDSLFNSLQYVYESSETVLILLSKNYYESTISKLESDEIFKIARKRKISIIPVQIENCKIPDSLLNFEIINISKDFEKGIDRIYDKLKILPEINLDNIGVVEFQNFVYDLLKEYGFKNLTWHFSDHVDFGFDLMGKYLNKDPFGFKTEETWLVEIKYYRAERFSISTINQLIDLYNKNRVPNTKILLITNSILTSVAEDFLKDVRNKEYIPISILDGNTIKKLVLKRKKLINKYFSK